MRFYINSRGQQTGPLNIPQVEEALQNGHLSPNDYAILEGENQWTTLAARFINVRQDPKLFLNKSLNLGVVPVNLAAAEWGRKAFPLQIKAKSNSLDVLKFFVVGIFAIIPVGAILIGVGLILQKRNDASIFILLGVPMLIFPIILYWLFGLGEKERVALLNAEGLITNGKQLFYWKDLCQIHYSYLGEWMATKSYSSGGGRQRHIQTNMNWYYSLLPKNHLRLGNSSLVVELIFANGRASMHPLAFDNNVMRNIVEGCPAILYRKSSKPLQF